MGVVELEIFNNLLSSVAEEMGEVLRRSSFSPNIRERKDYSCAIFDEKGELCAQASHIPVHLGAMPETIKHLLPRFSWQKGDVVITNDPYLGGTHLPDLTLVKPIYYQDKIKFFLIVRAHHADVGGAWPGSMALSTHISEEGFLIPPSLLYKRGKFNHNLWAAFLKAVRNPLEREGDLRAQVHCLERGEARLRELIEKFGEEKINSFLDDLKIYTERAFLELLQNFGGGEASFTDYLDDDGFNTKRIPIRVKVCFGSDKVVVNFSGNAPQVKGSVNAPRAVTVSAVYYVFLCLLQRWGEYPINEGCFRRIEVITEKGSLVDACYPAPVSAGNVETSQRIVDVLLGALVQLKPDWIPSASCGTMNNIAFGNDRLAYYETLGGGMGARPTSPGLSAVHTHMTNTLNTPVEVLENQFPLLIEFYRIRKGSGGRGKFRGGDGLVRGYLFLEDLKVSLLTERRRLRPYGLWGGEPGQSGLNILLRGKEKIRLPGKVSFEVKKGDRLRIYTPGGGGFKKP